MFFITFEQPCSKSRDCTSTGNLDKLDSVPGSTSSIHVDFHNVIKAINLTRLTLCERCSLFPAES